MAAWLWLGLLQLQLSEDQAAEGVAGQAGAAAEEDALREEQLGAPAGALPAAAAEGGEQGRAMVPWLP